MFCQKCGTQNADDATFCFKCGSKLIVIVQTETKQTIEKPTFIQSNDDSKRIEEVKKDVTIVNQQPKRKSSGWQYLFFFLGLIQFLVFLGNISNGKPYDKDLGNTIFYLIIGLTIRYSTKLGEMGILGFRSGKKWNMIVATFGYFLIVFTLLAAVYDLSGLNASSVSSQAPNKNAPISTSLPIQVSDPIPTSVPVAKFGDKVVVDNLAYTFNGMTTSTAIGEYVGNEFLGKKADGKFIILDATIENIGKESESISIGSYVKIVDDQGRTFEDDSTAEIYANEEAFPFTQLQPGLPKRGKIVFDVPQNLNGKIELSGGLFSEKRYISLSNTVVSTPVYSQTPSKSITTPTTNAVANGEIWDAGNGYTLKVMDIDLNTPRTVLIELYKNGNILDRIALLEGKTYTYETVFISNVTSISDAGVVFEHTKT